MKRKYSMIFMFLGALFITSLLISNILASNWIRAENILIPAGILIFPLTTIINDIIAIVYGNKAARSLIWISLIMNLLVAGSLLDLNLARIIVASVIASIVCLSVNDDLMRELHCKHRAEIAFFCGVIIDSVIFTIIAYGGTINIHDFIIIIGEIELVKIMYELLLYPLAKQIINKIKIKENLDVFEKYVERR